MMNFNEEINDIMPKRKATRLKEYNYNTPGAYFVTICTKDRKQLLSKIVGDGVLDVPQNDLTHYGKIADKHINRMNEFYEHISVDKYVIMPNHIHIIVLITDSENGTSRTPSPTNAEIPRFISTFKRYCNREYGHNIWQRSFHDHISRRGIIRTRLKISILGIFWLVVLERHKALLRPPHQNLSQNTRFLGRRILRLSKIVIIEPKTQVILSD